MNKLFKKSEMSFAVMWIVAYVVLSSLADQFSENIGISKSVTAVLHIVMSLILFFWAEEVAVIPMTKANVKNNTKYFFTIIRVFYLSNLIFLQLF